MDIHSILQTAGQIIYLGIVMLLDFLKWLGSVLYAWLMSIPFPTVMKLFGNPTMNKIIFGTVSVYILVINIAAFVMFASDKHRAKTNRGRVPEKSLMRICLCGGAIGGLLSMNALHHKTNVKKFKMAVPTLFILQLLVYSMLLGFLGFWAFF